MRMTQLPKRVLLHSIEELAPMDGDIAWSRKSQADLRAPDGDHGDFDFRSDDDPLANLP